MCHSTPIYYNVTAVKFIVNIFKKALHYMYTMLFTQ